MSTSPGTTDGLPTRKYVDCSTAHIERRVVELLEADAAFQQANEDRDQAGLPWLEDPSGSLEVDARVGGFLVSLAGCEDECPSRPELAARYGEPFAALIGLCLAAGADYLLLDRDGPVHPGLPTFEW